MATYNGPSMFIHDFSGSAVAVWQTMSSCLVMSRRSLNDSEMMLFTTQCILKYVEDVCQHGVMIACGDHIALRYLLRRCWSWTFETKKHMKPLEVLHFNLIFRWQLRKRCYIVKSFGQGNRAQMLFQKLEKPAGKLRIFVWKRGGWLNTWL